MPFAVWVTLTLIDDRGKSLANLGEDLWLGAAIPVSATVRIAVGGRLNKKIAIAMILLLSVAGVLLWKLVPMLPE
jgi:hypothetical protein